MKTPELPTPGRWYVTWGERKFYGSVFERDGQLWFRELPHFYGEPDMLVRDDGGIWEKATSVPAWLESYRGSYRR